VNGSVEPWQFTWMNDFLQFFSHEHSLRYVDTLFFSARVLIYGNAQQAS